MAGTVLCELIDCAERSEARSIDCAERSEARSIEGPEGAAPDRAARSAAVHDQKLAHLTLHNPGKANALDPPLLATLADLLTDLPRRGVRAAVISGSGTSFSGGYDIPALPADPPEDWVRDHGPIGAALRALRTLPTVAALNGPAVGSACELALSCDLRVMHSGAFLQMPPVRLGLIYTPAGIARLMALCGDGRARQMLLCAHRVRADEALAWGLCHELAPPDQVLARAFALARQMAAGAPLAVAGTKEVLELLLEEGPTLSKESAERVLALRRQSWFSQDAAEARTAFKERRPPRFTGR